MMLMSSADATKCIKGSKQCFFYLALAKRRPIKGMMDNLREVLQLEHNYRKPLVLQKNGVTAMRDEVGCPAGTVKGKGLELNKIVLIKAGVGGFD